VHEDDHHDLAAHRRREQSREVEAIRDSGEDRMTEEKPVEIVLLGQDLTPEQLDEALSISLKYTDADNGFFFAKEHASDVRYVEETGKWIVWDGTQWHEDASGKMALLMGERTMRSRFHTETMAPILDKDNVKKALHTVEVG